MSKFANDESDLMPTKELLASQDDLSEDISEENFEDLAVGKSHMMFLQQLKKLETKMPDLTDEELVKRIAEGDSDASMWLLVRHYKYILRKILDITGSHWYTDDILTAGTLGLYEAAKRFDEKKGIKFLTYAHYWILKMLYIEVRNEVLPMGGIGIGRDAKERAYNYLRYSMSGMSDEEIMKKLKITPRVLLELKLLSISCMRIRSLDDTLSSNGDDDDIDPYSRAGVPSSESAEDEFFSKEFIRYVEGKIEQLRSTGKEQVAELLSYELGLCGKDQLAKAETCKVLNISRKEYEKLRREGNKFLRTQMISDGWYDANVKTKDDVE